MLKKRLLCVDAHDLENPFKQNLEKEWWSDLNHPHILCNKEILAQVLTLLWTLFFLSPPPPHPPLLLPAVLEQQSRSGILLGSWSVSSSSCLPLFHSVCRVSLRLSFPDLRPEPSINSLCCCLLRSVCLSVTCKFCMSTQSFHIRPWAEETLLFPESNRTVGVLTEALLKVPGGVLCCDKLSNFAAEYPGLLTTRCVF